MGHIGEHNDLYEKGVDQRKFHQQSAFYSGYGSNLLDFQCKEC